MTDEAKALVGKLRERAAKVREWIISSQRVVDLLAPEREKFDKREAPWDTYTVRMSVDHQSSIRTQTKEVEEYEQAADLIETQAREIERLREALGFAMRTLEAEGFSDDGPTLNRIRAALAGDSHV